MRDYDFRLRMATDEEKRAKFGIASDSVAVLELDGEVVALGDDYGTAHLPDGDGGWVFGAAARHEGSIADDVEILLEKTGEIYMRLTS